MSLAFHLLAPTQAAAQRCTGPVSPEAVSVCHDACISSMQQHEHHEPAGCCCRIAEAEVVREEAADKSVQLQHEIEDHLKAHRQLRSLIEAQAQHKDIAQQLELVRACPAQSYCSSSACCTVRVA